jgi:hypothetical protein
MVILGFRHVLYMTVRASRSECVLLVSQSVPGVVSSGGASLIPRSVHLLPEVAALWCIRLDSSLCGCTYRGCASMPRSSGRPSRPSRRSCSSARWDSSPTRSIKIARHVLTVCLLVTLAGLREHVQPGLRGLQGDLLLHARVLLVPGTADPSDGLHVLVPATPTWCSGPGSGSLPPVPCAASSWRQGFRVLSAPTQVYADACTGGLL